MLGDATVCRSKDQFERALKWHPAFVSSAVLSNLPEQLRDLFPKLELVVDSVAAGTTTVGVEWHVEVGGTKIWLGRGLTQATVSPTTGLIERVVDIAEAPWRLVGTLLAPVISAFAVAVEAGAANRAKGGGL